MLLLKQTKTCHDTLKWQNFHQSFVECILVVLVLGLRSGIAKSYGESAPQSTDIEFENGKDLYHGKEEENVHENVSKFMNFEDRDEDIDLNPNEKGRFWWTFRNRTTNQPGNDSISQIMQQPNPLNDTFNFLSSLFRYVILNKNSPSRVQFFNANYNGNTTFNATSPRAIFGSPLCLGICGVAQVYWANSSVGFLSGNKFPLPTLGPPSAPKPPAIG